MIVCVLLDLMIVFVPFLTQTTFMDLREGISGTQNAASGIFHGSSPAHNRRAERFVVVKLENRRN